MSDPMKITEDWLGLTVFHLSVSVPPGDHARMCAICASWPTDGLFHAGAHGMACWPCASRLGHSGDTAVVV